MDDLINRQTAIDVIEKWLECSDYNEAERHIMRATESILYDLPSVNQQEPCEDAISRKALKYKLQEHHDFFVNAYGGFSNLPQNDKARVDEISNCIAMVVNEPPVNPQSKTGHWIKYGKLYQCSECEELSCCQGKFCNECGAKMVEPQERSE